MRQLLLELIEPESQSKTVPATSARLLAALSRPGQDESRLVQVLRTLQDADVVRQRINPDHEGDAVWLLYHDYLCRGVLELDRRARRWQILLEEAMCAFEGARGIVRRWRALLDPVLQIRFAYAWLRGRLRHGRASRFAGLSTLRLVVNVWILGLALGFFGWRYLSARQDARTLFYVFTVKSETSSNEAEALWELSRAKMDVQKAFYEIVFSKEINAKRFLGKSDHILHATFGLKANDRLIARTFNDNCYKSPAVEYSQACLKMLNDFSVHLVENSVSGTAADRIVEVMSQTKDGRQWSSLARGLEALGAKLLAETAEKAFNRIVEAMSQTQNAGQLDALAHALGEELRDNAAEWSLRALLAALRPLPEPPCATAKTLIRNKKESLQPIIGLLKWPTCSSEDRRQLIEKLAQVTGQPFGQTVDGIFQPDLGSSSNGRRGKATNPSVRPRIPNPWNPS